MKETKKKRYIVSTIMYGMILIFIQLPWVVLKGKNYSIYREDPSGQGCGIPEGFGEKRRS